MRNFLFLAFVALMLAACNIRNDVSGCGLPSHVSHIEFWNGGGKIAEYDDAKIEVATFLATRIVGQDISYYVYKITVDGKTECVVDSESLAIKFVE